MSESSEEEVPGTFQPQPSKFDTTRGGVSSDSESGDEESVTSRTSSPDLLGTELQPSNADMGGHVITDNVQEETVDDGTNVSFIHLFVSQEYSFVHAIVY